MATAKQLVLETESQTITVVRGGIPYMGVDGQFAFHPRYAIHYRSKVEDDRPARGVMSLTEAELIDLVVLVEQALEAEDEATE
jgi:hypothetical protein